jgi:hypothetical protein
MKCGAKNVRLKIATSAISIIAAIMNTSAFAQDRYDLLLTEANYSTAEQRDLSYTAFVGDRQTGAIYSCDGQLHLNKKGYLQPNPTLKCAGAAPSGSLSGQYTFSIISGIDVAAQTAKQNQPRMNAAWGFWRIDQTNGRLAFCYKAIEMPPPPAKDPVSVWKCFDTAILP